MGIFPLGVRLRKDEERAGQKGTFERLGKCATEVASLFLNPMTDNRLGTSLATSLYAGLFFPMVEKNSGPFAEYLNRDRLRLSTFQFIAYSYGRRDGTLLLRLVRSEDSTGIRHGIR